MYQLVTAYVQPRGKWMGDLEQDVSNLVVRDLYSASSKVILVLSHPGLLNLQTLDLQDVVERIFQLPIDMTFTQWFVSLGDQSLPTKEGEPTITKGRVKSVHAFIAGFDVKVWDKNVSTDLPETTGIGNDLLLTKYFEDEDEKYGDYLLCSVNGAMHITDYTQTKLFVEGAGVSITKAASPNIMLHSFKEIGKVKQIPFKNCIFNGSNGRPMEKGIWLQLPEEIGNRTVMLSIAGILYTVQEGWNVTGNRNLMIDKLLDRLWDHYINTRDHIDWSHVENMMALRDTHIGGLFESLFLSDEGLTAILEMPQSFVILVDHPAVYADNVPLDTTALPGKYYDYDRNVDYPLRLSNGLLPSYVPIKERVATRRPVWVLGCDPAVSRTYHLYKDTYEPAAYDFMPDVVQSRFPFRYASAYKLIIQSITIELP